MLHHWLIKAQKSTKEGRYELLHLRQHHLSIYGLFWHVFAKSVLVERGSHSLNPSLVSQSKATPWLHYFRSTLPHLTFHVYLLDDLGYANIVTEPFPVGLLHRVVRYMRPKLHLLEVFNFVLVCQSLWVCLGLLASEEFLQWLVWVLQKQLNQHRLLLEVSDHHPREALCHHVYRMVAKPKLLLDQRQ